MTNELAVTGCNVVVDRELTLRDQAVLEARGCEIVATFGPSRVSTRTPAGPTTWREVEDSRGFVVNVTAASERAAIENVRMALEADDVATWEAYPVAG